MNFAGKIHKKLFPAYSKTTSMTTTTTTKNTHEKLLLLLEEVDGRINKHEKAATKEA